MSSRAILFSIDLSHVFCALLCCAQGGRAVQCNADLEVLLELSLVLTGQLLMLLLELADK